MADLAEAHAEEALAAAPEEALAAVPAPVAALEADRVPAVALVTDRPHTVTFIFTEIRIIAPDIMAAEAAVAQAFSYLPLYLF